MKKAGMLSLFRSLVLSALCLSMGCTGHETDIDRPEPCSDEWVALVERQIPTSDSQGHGPDPGGEEVEFKLGIRDNPEVPDRGSREWCDHIEAHIRWHENLSRD